MYSLVSLQRFQGERRNVWGTVISAFHCLQAGGCSNFNNQSCLPREHLFHQRRPARRFSDDMAQTTGARKHIACRPALYYPNYHGLGR